VRCVAVMIFRALPCTLGLRVPDGIDLTTGVNGDTFERLETAQRACVRGGHAVTVCRMLASLREVGSAIALRVRLA